MLVEPCRDGQDVRVEDDVGRIEPGPFDEKTVGALADLDFPADGVGLSDFVGNLGNGPLLKKPIEIVKSQVESSAAQTGAAPVELINFTVKAELASSGRAGGAAPVPAGRGAPPPAAK